MKRALILLAVVLALALAGLLYGMDVFLHLMIGTLP